MWLELRTSHTVYYVNAVTMPALYLMLLVQSFESIAKASVFRPEQELLNNWSNTHSLFNAKQYELLCITRYSCSNISNMYELNGVSRPECWATHCKPLTQG